METSKRYFIEDGGEKEKKSRSRKKKFKNEWEGAREKDEDELLLEQLVFGGEAGFVKKLNESEEAKSDLSFYIDVGGDDDDEGEGDHKGPAPTVRKPAWIDEDDEGEERRSSKADSKVLADKLRSEFYKISGEHTWAIKKRDADDDEEKGLLEHAGDYVSRDSVRLPPTKLSISRCRNANHKYPSASRVNSVMFHPSAQVICTAGYNHRLSLFQVDGKENNKIESVYFDRFPIETACLLRGGNLAVLGSVMAKHFYTYDLMSGRVRKIPKIMFISDEIEHMGKFISSTCGKLLGFHGKRGSFHLLNVGSMEYVTTLTHTTDINCSTWSHYNDQHLYTAGKEGRVYVWDVRQRKCPIKFIDEGAVEVTSLAESSDGKYLAVGSNTGVVNIYDRHGITSSQSEPKPVKAITNLTTSVTHLKFNSNMEILAMASQFKLNAVKMVHLPSLTTFSNFPLLGRGRESDVGHALCQDFSTNGGFYACGSYSGRIPLYRLHHYTSY